MENEDKLQILSNVYLVAGLLTLLSSVILLGSLFRVWYLYYNHDSFEHGIAPFFQISASIILFLSYKNIRKGNRFKIIATIGCILGLVSTYPYIFYRYWSPSIIKYYQLLLIIVMIFFIIALLATWLWTGLERNKLRHHQMQEIKKLLRESHSMSEIRGKIQNWKEEGYDVDELETVIELDKSKTVKQRDKLSELKSNFCHKCGSKFSDNSKFCSNCGTKLL